MTKVNTPSPWRGVRCSRWLGGPRPFPIYVYRENQEDRCHTKSEPCFDLLFNLPKILYQSGPNAWGSRGYPYLQTEGIDIAEICWCKRTQLNRI